MTLLPADTPWLVQHGDCLEQLRHLPDNSVDAIVTDPPAGIEFMGKEWDSFRGDSRQPDDPTFHRSGAGPFDRAKVRHGTSSGYHSGMAFGDTFAPHGYSDGGQRLAAPAQKLSNRNPMCRKCHKHIRGAGGCICEEPEPDEDAQFVFRARLRQRDAFIDYIQAIMVECLRTLKPGGHALVWALPRTSHWTGTAIEEAGFEIRDCVFHFFGSGFPKSLDVSKAIDKLAGAEREVVGRKVRPDGTTRTTEGGRNSTPFVAHAVEGDALETQPATPEAEEWAGWGTALKPAVECWWLARKPLESTVAANVLKHGTGALNIDGCRVAIGNESIHAPQSDPTKRNGVVGTDLGFSGAELADFQAAQRESAERTQALGRWPAHLVLSHTPECRCVGMTEIKGARVDTRPEGDGGREDKSQWRCRPTEATRRGYSDDDGKETIEAWECSPDCPVRILNEQSGMSVSSGGFAASTGAFGNHGVYQRATGQETPPGFGDTGGASRFFYTPKPARSERNLGGVENRHPTVKSIALMRWLVRMITPPGGTVLDPFTGSGTTGCAVVLEGGQFVGFEREAEYLEIAKARIAYCAAHPEEFAPKPKKKVVRPHGRPVPKPVPALAPAPVPVPAPAGDVNSWLSGIMVAVKG